MMEMMTEDGRWEEGVLSVEAWMGTMGKMQRSTRKEEGL